MVLTVNFQAKTKFPQLENYVHCWLVTDIIRMRLKYTSGRKRRLKAFRVAEGLAEAASSAILKTSALTKAAGKSK